MWYCNAETELKKFERKHRSLVLRPVRAIRVSGRGLGAERDFFRHAWQVTSHSKSPRTPGNEAGSTDQLKIYAWSNFLPRWHVDGAELRLGKRSCVVLVKGATKTYNLFRNIALKTNRKAMVRVLCVLPPTIKPASQQMKVASSCVNTDYD